MIQKSYTGMGIYIDTARYVPTNMLFKNGNVTKERIVDCYELVYFLEDGGSCFINGKKYPIVAGSVRFHRPGDRVQSYRYNQIYLVHFLVDSQEQNIDVFSQIPSFTHLVDIDNEIETLKELIQALLEKKNFECISCLCKLLHNIIKCPQTQQAYKNPKNTALIKDYIDHHFAEKITLSELADKFYMHPIYMQKKFKKETGITPSEYIKKVRLSHTKTYLLTTDLTIDEISELTGFCNTSYCIKVFKEETDLTPNQFRQRALLAEDFL